MAIITSDSKIENKGNTINSENLNQLDSVFNSKAAEPKEIKIIETSPKNEVKTTKKRDNTDTLLLHLPKGERNNFKILCTQNNITMTDFIYFAMDYVRDLSNSGAVTIGRNGIKEVVTNN